MGGSVAPGRRPQGGSGDIRAPRYHYSDAGALRGSIAALGTQRTILSPFTKGCRGHDALMRLNQFFWGVSDAKSPRGTQAALVGTSAVRAPPPIGSRLEEEVSLREGQ